MKPTVFIGSSKEGIDVARAIRTQLDEVAEITIWNEGSVFTLGHGYLEALVNALPGFDFAILVLSADDSIESRGQTSLAPRDNVMFELGLFMGRLGRQRTFAICDESQKVKLPSDLAGVSLAEYRSRRDGNLVAAVGVATDQIRSVIRSLGIHEARASQQLQQATSTIETASDLKIDQLKLERDRLREHVAKLDQENNQSLDEGKITLGEHSRIFNQIHMLRNALAELNIELFRTTVASITLPDDSPGARIKASIDKLEAAINEIQNLQKLLDTVAEVINAVNNIIGILISI
jgi:hypothetical protein